MSNYFRRNCMFCNQEICIRDDAGNGIFTAFEIGGNRHYCLKKRSAK